MNHQGSSFLSGCAPYTDLIFCAKTNDALDDEGKPNSAFFAADRDDWIKYDEIVSWPAISMATAGSGDERTVVAIGPNGDFWELANGSLKEALGVVSTEDVNLRALAVVDETIYAVGMDRLVLRRDGISRWTPVGPRPAGESEGIIGFEDMDGYSSKEMYAVGWQGEMWLFEKNRWRQIDSPVSANLNAVSCGSDGVVYVAGDDGALLRGRNDRWHVIETGRTDNLMDVCEYEGSVYVVTDFRILKLVDDSLIDETNFGEQDDRPTSCLYLFRAEDGVVSEGPKDLFRLRDGAWERLV